MKRNVLSSPRLLELKKRRRRAILNKFLIFLFGFLIILIALSYASRLKNFNISEVDVIGNKVLEVEVIKNEVNQLIAGKYLWFFPKTNVLIYPKNSIRDDLQDKFKRIRNIDLSLKDNKILIVSLSERKALYTWCGINSPQDTAQDQKCYFLDEDGYVFDEAPYFSDEVYFKFFGLADLPKEEDANTYNPMGFYLTKNFKQLTAFKDTLIKINLNPIAEYITPEKDIEISLSGKNSSEIAPKIILRMDADFQNVAENLEAALTTEPLKSEFKNRYASLQYIDLRFGNKVYYKF